MILVFRLIFKINIRKLDISIIVIVLILYWRSNIFLKLVVMKGTRNLKKVVNIINFISFIFDVIFGLVLFKIILFIKIFEIIGKSIGYFLMIIFNFIRIEIYNGIVLNSIFLLDIFIIVIVVEINIIEIILIIEYIFNFIEVFFINFVFVFRIEFINNSIFYLIIN